MVRLGCFICWICSLVGVIMNDKQRARRKGKRFENEVQADLESQGWIVMRFTKKVEDGKLINCRPKWAGGRLLSFQSGFPDFLVLRGSQLKLVECKVNGYLNPEEREQVKVLKELGFEIEVAFEENGIQYKPAVADA